MELLLSAMHGSGTDFTTIVDDGAFDWSWRRLLEKHEKGSSETPLLHGLFSCEE
jgi:hypothetical protein